METDFFGNPVKTEPIIVTRELMYEFLHNFFKEITTVEQLSTLITNEFENIIEYARLCNGGKGCTKMSLLFNPHRLSTRTKDHKQTVFTAIRDERGLRNLCRVFSLKTNNGVRDVLYMTMALSPSLGFAYEFPPHTMRNLCSTSGIKKHSKILDPCAGWGGRMIGASTMCDNYEAFEPSTRTHHGLLKLAKFIQEKLRPDFSAVIHKLPFEESTLKKEYYDMACTSPPYFDTEHYSEESTNSFNRYKSFDQWVEGFYEPLITKTMKSLKSGCIFHLNINDRKYPLSKTLKKIAHKKYSVTHIGSMGFAVHGFGKDPSKGETVYSIMKK